MMMRITSLFSVALLAALSLSPVTALKFDLAAHTGHDSRYERCIRNFVSKDTLVLVTAIVDGHKGDGQVVNMHVREIQHAPLILAIYTRLTTPP